MAPSGMTKAGGAISDTPPPRSQTPAQKIEVAAVHQGLTGAHQANRHASERSGAPGFGVQALSPEEVVGDGPLALPPQGAVQGHDAARQARALRR